MALKNCLKKIRMAEFMQTKRAFSSYLQISEQQYFRYESGGTMPSLDIAIKISDKLNRPVNEIWFEEEQ